jgi:hypothetical protein
MKLNQNLDFLINQWCERKALKPLKHLLPVYPGPVAHTNQVYELLDGLQNVKGFCRDDLKPDEVSHLISSINELEDRLKKA